MRYQVLALLVLGAAQQTAPAFQNVGQPAAPTGIIDGSVSPDLIPDIVAFRLFLSAVAGQSSTQDAKLQPIGLGSADTGALVQVLPNFATALRQALATRPQGSLDGVAQVAVDSMRAEMSPEGFQRLQAYVRSQKKFMKRAPYRPCTTIVEST